MIKQLWDTSTLDFFSVPMEKLSGDYKNKPCILSSDTERTSEDEQKWDEIDRHDFDLQFRPSLVQFGFHNGFSYNMPGWIETDGEVDDEYSCMEGLELSGEGIPYNISCRDWYVNATITNIHNSSIISQPF